MEYYECQILVIADNDVDIRIFQEALSNTLKIDTCSVKDGETAIKYLKKEDDFKHVPTPALIILDLRLPKKNGLDVLKEIKQDSKLKKIPVIIITISEEESDILKSYNLYANAYIVKPVKTEAFIDALKTLKEFWFKISKLPP